MGSEGKFETRTMARALRLAMGLEKPLGPKPAGPGRNGEEEASSYNHRLIAWACMLLWACLAEDEAEIERLLGICTHHLRHQLTFEFESYPGGPSEQRACAHKKQHYQAVSLMAYVGWRFAFPELLALALAWLRCSLTLDELFLAPSPSPRGKLPAILQPGFRAAPPDGLRDFVAEAWWRVVRERQPLPSSVMDPLANVDEASLWFYAQLPEALREKITLPLAVPTLRHPITIQRGRNNEFIASIEWKPGLKDVQTCAGWVGGEEVYGFNEVTVPRLVAASIQVLAGAPVAAPPLPAGIPPYEEKGVPMPEPLRIPPRFHALWRGDASVGGGIVRRPFYPDIRPWGPTGGTEEQYSVPDLDLFLQRYGARGETPAERRAFYDNHNPAADFGENANTVPELLKLAIAAGHYGRTDLVLTAEAIGDARFLVPKGTDFWQFQGKPPEEPEKPWRPAPPEKPPEPVPPKPPEPVPPAPTVEAEVKRVLAALLEPEMDNEGPPWLRRLRVRLMEKVKDEQP